MIVSTAFLGLGCQSAYYGTMETFGVHKRDILVDRVAEARDEQNEAKEQFRSALEEFSAVTNFQGGDLEALYNRLNDAYEDSNAQARAVRSRIDRVEDVAEALFDEWRDELDDYRDEELRRASERQYRETKVRSEELIAAMRRAESTMYPVLDAFHDQVLFLKHNLNARAVASLDDELADLESDIARLIEEMEASIAQANAFIDEMQASAP